MVASRTLSVKEFSRIGSEWDNIAFSDLETTPFQTFAWNSYWWEHLRGDKQMKVIVCEDANEIIGIFPMWLRVLPDNLKILEFIGTRGTDYLCPLISKSRVSVYECVMKYIIDSDICDVVNFEDVAEHHSLIAWSVSFANRHNVVTRETEASPCYTIHLPATWDGYLSQLSKRKRKDISYDRGYLQRNFRVVEFEFNCGRERIAEHIRMHQLRRGSLNTRGTYESEEVAKFIRDTVSAWDDTGILRLSMLFLDSIPAASILSCKWQEKMFAVHTGFEIRFSKYSPGTTLLGYCLQESIRQRLSEYDLSRGYDKYKTEWNGRLCKNTRLLISKSMSTIERYLKEVTPLHEKIGYSPSML